MEQRESFGAVLKRLRVAAGLTHEALAERSNLGARTISDLERGISRSPRADTLALLIDALEASPGARTLLEAAARTRPGAIAPDCRTALPVQLTRFVGRHEEIGAVSQLLRRDEVRLVTLTGPGGVGKTRLAHEIARNRQGAFSDGIVAVGLAAVTTADEAFREIARQLDPVQAADPSVTRIAALVADKNLLLVLDNCEHLPTIAVPLADLLRSAARLTVLATSRAPLRVSGEREFHLQPLPVPRGSKFDDLVLLAENPAVALFVDRARHVDPDFTLTSENAGTIAAICVRLDGLPLAVELAAARVRALSPQMLNDRLQDPNGEAVFSLLARGMRDLPPRHQTLHDTIAWSHDLLTTAQQELFRRLSVFADGFTIEAAEAICGSQPESPTFHALDVLSELMALVEQSLVARQPVTGGGSRYSMLETIRAFAMERLIESGEAPEIRERHARFYLAIVETTGAVLFASADKRARLAAENGNVQAALQWLVQAD